MPRTRRPHAGSCRAGSSTSPPDRGQATRTVTTPPAATTPIGPPGCPPGVAPSSTVMAPMTSTGTRCRTSRRWFELDTIRARGPRRRGADVLVEGAAVELGGPLLRFVLGEHDPVPALPVAPRRRLERDRQGVAHHLRRHRAVEVSRRTTPWAAPRATSVAPWSTRWRAPTPTPVARALSLDRRPPPHRGHGGGEPRTAPVPPGARPSPNYTIRYHCSRRTSSSGTTRPPGTTRSTTTEAGGAPIARCIGV